MNTVADRMSKTVVSVAENDPVETVAKVFLESGHHLLPVLDAEGKVTGVITEHDLIDAHRQVHLPTVISILDSVIPVAGLQEYREELRKVTAVDAKGLASRRHLILARPEDSLEDAADRMFEHHVHALPVVDGEGHLLGILSRSDILRGLLARQ
ncbi:MAG: CBS domain-containing protein [Acidithiobacillus sp.]|nr:CBS domain-containing protein [Acidithiobacillus sp.]